MSDQNEYEVYDRLGWFGITIAFLLVVAAIIGTFAILAEI